MKRLCLPIIETELARCTCGKWNGATRHSSEHIGVFTHRAHESFKIHESELKRAESVQVNLFEEQKELFA